jgi:hypothetical protein
MIKFFFNMSCEFIDTQKCPLAEGISALRLALREAAVGLSAKNLRDLVCRTDVKDVERAKDCPTFRTRKGL